MYRERAFQIDGILGRVRPMKTEAPHRLVVPNLSTTKEPYLSQHRLLAFNYLST